jgi:hypothetical protein
MLSSSLLFPSFYWFFILLAVIDGAATRFRSELVLSLDRIFYAFVLIVFGSLFFGFDALSMITETVLVIALVDLLFLIRRIPGRSGSDFTGIISQRFRSYTFTLLPAGILSIGLTFLGGLVIGVSLVPRSPILELGLSSIAVFLLILFATRRPEVLEHITS